MNWMKVQGLAMCVEMSVWDSKVAYQTEGRKDAD